MASLQWVSVTRGDPLPAGAIQAGHYHKDGVLYIGKASNGEIGKYNIHNGRVYNLWTHDAGKWGSGQILVCPDDVVVWWCRYDKDDPLLPLAFQAGHYHKDGVLYVGRRDRGGQEVGKINVDNCIGGNNAKIHNLWCHDTGRHSSGEILCCGFK